MNAYQPCSVPSWRMLCLGDSYTIGEGVLPDERFAHQAVRILQERNMPFDWPVLIATTGWTTADLMAHLAHQKPTGTFDIVTLLIGVNNQYRGLSLDNYQEEFSALFQQAIHYAADDSRRVIVLSIPDWGVTPYAEGRNRKQIAEEIDRFNTINQSVTLAYGATYLDITKYSRLYPQWVTSDGLHPNAQQYALWANDLADAVEVIIKNYLIESGNTHTG